MFLWQINTDVEYDEFCKVLLCTFLIFQEIKDYMIFQFCTNKYTLKWYFKEYLISFNKCFKEDKLVQNTFDSRYLEFQGTLWNTSRYPYLDISDLQNWGKNNSINHI